MTLNPKVYLILKYCCFISESNIKNHLLSSDKYQTSVCIGDLMTIFGTSVKTGLGIPDLLKSLPSGTPVTYPQQAAVTAPDLTGSQFPRPASATTNENEIVVNGQRIDNRVRLRPLSPATVLGPTDPNNILYPLFATNGLLFPYTPTIQFSQDVDWKNTDLTHTNYDMSAYSRTPSASISISGKFSVQTTGEGRYLLAALHYLRVVSKMYFGKAEAAKSNGRPGLPPPVLLFSGYGPYMFNDLRVIVKNHSYTLDDTANMVTVTTPAGDPIMLPAVLTLSLTLGVVQTPEAQRNEFDLDKFRTGELMMKKGWI